MVSGMTWFIFFSPMWISIIIAILYYKNAKL